MKNLVIGPYDFAYAEQAEDFSQFSWDLNQNRWSYVFDFTPPPGSRSWRLMRPDEFKGDHFYQSDPFEDKAECVVPRHVSYGGTLSDAIVEGSPEQQEALANLGKKPKEEDDSDPFAAPGEIIPSGIEVNSVNNPFGDFSAYEIPQNSDLNFEVIGNQSSEPYSLENTEEDARRKRLNEEENARMIKVRELMDQEIKQKGEKRRKAQEELDRYREDRLLDIKQRKELNKKTNEAINASQNGASSEQVLTFLYIKT